MKHIFPSFLLVLLLGLTACGDMQQSLEHAGNNRTELEKILHHYKNDEQKHEGPFSLFPTLAVGTLR